ncbi:MAG: hypothetical protein WC777_03465 [Candidatus Gracilibacteria bacterium]|jgi:hypothetical protein
MDNGLTEADRRIIIDGTRLRSNAVNRGLDLSGEGFEAALLECVARTKKGELFEYPDYSDPEQADKSDGNIRTPSAARVQELLRAQLINAKNILIVSGFGANGNILANYGQAAEVTVVDSDPVTVAWQEAIQRYYYKKDPETNFTLGELVIAPLTPSIGRIHFTPNVLDPIYPGYKAPSRAKLESKLGDSEYYTNLIKRWVIANEKAQPLENLHIQRAELGDLWNFSHSITRVLADRNNHFDSAIVPFLIDQTNGVIGRTKIEKSCDEIWELCHDDSFFFIVSDGDQYLKYIPKDRFEKVEPDKSLYLPFQYNSRVGFHLFRVRKDR